MVLLERFLGSIPYTASFTIWRKKRKIEEEWTLDPALG
jgi:hypothetical protein